MSFGLGYFENGTWVDHSTPDGTRAPGSAGGDVSASDAVALDAVHRWYGCCADSTAAWPSVIDELGTPGELDGGASVVAHARRHDATVVPLMPVTSVRVVEK
jgi:hypothetical protein